MGRPPRQAQVTAERRRRQPGTLDRLDQLKLAIPDEIKAKHPDKVFRWVNDDPRRINALTKKDDWDVVEGVERMAVGIQNNGQPHYQVLCAKPKEFWEQDQREKAKSARDTLTGIVRDGKPPQPNPEQANTYVPDGNTVKTEGYAP